MCSTEQAGQHAIPFSSCMMILLAKLGYLMRQGGCKRRRPVFTKTNGLGPRSLLIGPQRTDLPRKSIIGAPKRTSWRKSRIAKIDRAEILNRARPELYRGGVVAMRQRIRDKPIT